MRSSRGSHGRPSRRRSGRRREHRPAARRDEGRSPPRRRRDEGRTGSHALGADRGGAHAVAVLLERPVFRPSEIGGEAAVVAGQRAVEILRRELVSDLLFRATRDVGGSRSSARSGSDEHQGTAEKNGGEHEPADEQIRHWTPPWETRSSRGIASNSSDSASIATCEGTGVAPLREGGPAVRGWSARAAPSPFATVER